MNKKESRGIYNDKKQTHLRDIKFVEDAVINELIYVVKGYHNKNDKYGYGTKHIKFRHLDDPNKRGYIKLDELVNLGNSLREYVKKFEKPFIDKQGAKIYEWEDDDKTRFRLVVDKKKIKKASISPRHTSISQAHTLTNQGTSATSIANVIISFYSDRNLKDKMQFKNPQVEDFYKKIQNTSASADTLELLKKLNPLPYSSRVQETEVAKSLNNGEVAHTTTPPIANSDSATIPNPTLNNTETTNLKQITRDTAVLAPQSSALLIKTYEQLGEERLAHTLISTIETDKVTMQEVSKHYLALDNNTDELKAQLSELGKQQTHTQTLSEGAERVGETAETKNDNKPKGPRQ